MKKSTINDRILYLVENQYENNQKKFAESINFSPQVVFNIVSGRKSKPSFDVLESILSTNDNISPEWLLTGEGEMLRDQEPQKPAFKSYMKEVTPPQPLPKMPINAYAGLGVGDFVITENDIEEWYTIPEFKNADFLISIKGSSMQPKYNGGDIVACKHITSYTFFQWGVPHVMHVKNQGVMVKRPYLGTDENHIELRSDNERYPPFEISKNDIINISIVLGVIRLE